MHSFDGGWNTFPLAWFTRVPGRYLTGRARQGPLSTNKPWRWLSSIYPKDISIEKLIFSILRLVYQILNVSQVTNPYAHWKLGLLLRELKNTDI